MSNIGYSGSMKHHSRTRYSSTNPKIKYRSYGFRYFSTVSDAEQFAKEQGNVFPAEQGNFNTGFGYVRKDHYRVKIAEPKEYNGRKVITSALEDNPFENETPEQSAQSRIKQFYPNKDTVKIHGKTYVLE